MYFCIGPKNSDHATGLKIRLSNPGRDKRFFFSPKGPDLLWGHLAFCSMGIAVIPSRT